MMRKSRMPARVFRDLESPDSAKRRSAAEALAEGDERALYPLIKALRDIHPGVQDAAMRSLIAIGGEAAAWMVLPLLREGPFLRNAAMVILREIGGGAVPHLPPLFKDKDDDVRKFAIELVAASGARGQGAALSGLLSDDPNPNVRAAAALALGVLGCRESLPVLVSALKDVEWVRFSALESLAGLREDAAVDPILALLPDPSQATRCAAIEALGAIGSPRAGDALLSHLGDSERDERTVVLKSLLRLGVPLSGAGIAEDLLAIFRGDEDWGERLVALLGLIGVADEGALRAIVDAAGSLDAANPVEEEILSAIKEVLRGARDPGAFHRLFGDPPLRFRGKAILAEIAGDLRIREAVPDLVSLLKTDVRDVRRAAARALGRIGDEAAREALTAALRDPDGHVRKDAVSALGAVGGREASGPLLSVLLEETFEDVIEAAALALVSIDPETLSAVSGELTTGVRRIVEAVASGRAARETAGDGDRGGRA